MHTLWLDRLIPFEGFDPPVKLW